MSATPLVLTQGERVNPVCVRICRELKRQLQEQRERNDQKHDADVTANIRGRIAAIKELIALVEDTSPSS